MVRGASKQVEAERALTLIKIFFTTTLETVDATPSNAHIHRANDVPAGSRYSPFNDPSASTSVLFHSAGV